MFQLITFLQFRLADEDANDPAYVYIASLEHRPRQLSSIGSPKLAEWKKAAESYLTALRDPLIRHLAKVRTSPRYWENIDAERQRIYSYVEDLKSQLEQKGRLEHKYKQLEILAGKKQTELSENIVQWQEQYELLCDSARQLQGEVSCLFLLSSLLSFSSLCFQIEDDISKLYNGREVNIIGEIQAVLYNNWWDFYLSYLFISVLFIVELYTSLANIRITKYNYMPNGSQLFRIRFR